jgi:hypothetical protein
MTQLGVSSGRNFSRRFFAVKIAIHFSEKCQTHLAGRANDTGVGPSRGTGLGNGGQEVGFMTIFKPKNSLASCWTGLIIRDWHLSECMFLNRDFSLLCEKKLDYPTLRSCQANIVDSE